MRNSILAMSLVAAALMGGLAGGAIRDHQIHTAEEDAWSDVIVINEAGSLVANPAGMTPTDLAAATIIDPLDHLYIVDCGGKWKVDTDCPNWKEIRFTGKAKN